MPAIKSAKKKLKVDRKRESANKKAKIFIDFLIKKAKKKPTPENIRKTFKAIDKSVKNNIFHKNKGARIKSQLSKLLVKPAKSVNPAAGGKKLKKNKE